MKADGTEILVGYTDGDGVRAEETKVIEKDEDLRRPVTE